MSVDLDSRAAREKRRASLVSVAAVSFLILLKVAVGLLTGSLGVLAQAADSVLDLVAAVLAFFAVRLADQPPDPEHPYGHGKIENLAALAETGLLLLTCAWIAYEAIQRLFFRPVEIASDWWAIGVMLLSIVVSLALSRYLMDIGRRHRSQSLEANALNFRTDVLSSSVVILGLALVQVSHILGPNWAWLQQADAVAALLVILPVLRVSLGIGWRAINELLDAAPSGLTGRITAEVADLPGVQAVGPVRVRQAGSSTFADLTVSVDRSASLQEAHQIATAVEDRVGEIIEQGDVVVHVSPIRSSGESLPQAVSAIAARFGLRTHDIHVHQVRDRKFVDLDVEVPPELSLAEAHDLVSRLESAVLEEVSGVDEIHTHIEPRDVPVSQALLDPELVERLRAEVSGAVGSVAGLYGCHNVHVRPGADGYDIVLHCLADPGLPVEETHRIASRAERAILAQVPETAQVLIHLEPGHCD
jgi:cation diffusion facilitator family transporter